MKVLDPPVSLQFKLIALVGSLFVIFMWALVLLSASFLQREFGAVLNDEQYATVQRLATELDEKLAERVRSLSNVARNLPKDLSPAVLNPFLVELKALQSVFPSGVSVLDMNGMEIADFPYMPERHGMYYGDRDYFVHAVATGQPYIGRPVMGRALKRPIMTVGVPAFGADGRMRAVLTGVIDLSAPNFLAVIANPTMTGKGRFYIISTRDSELLAGSEHDTAPLPMPVGKYPIFDRFRTGFEGSFVADDGANQHMLVSGKALPRAGWVVVARMPTEVAYGPLRHWRQLLFMTAAILTILAAFAIQWIARRLLAPLDEAGRAMHAMTRGTAPLAPLPVRQQDEVGQLIGHFNLLVEERRRHEAALADSEARWRLLVEGAPDAIMVQTGAVFSYVNQAAVRLFGADSRSALVGQDVVARSHPDSRGLDELCLTPDGGMAGQAGPMERRYLRMDGSAVDVEVSAVPFSYADKQGSLIFMREIGERLRANAVLRQSEARYRSLLDHMLEGFAYCRLLPAGQDEADFDYLEINPAFLRLTGLAADLVLQGASRIPALTQFNALLVDACRRVADSGCAERFEVFGGPLLRWYTVSVYSTAAERHVIVFLNDISDQKYAEQQLRTQEEEVRALVENAPDLIARFDRAARCVYANAAVEAAARVARVSLLGRDFTDTPWPGPAGRQWVDSIAKVFASARMDTFEAELPTPAGLRHFQARVVPEFEADGSVRNVVAVARDISIIKGGEAVLRDSEQRLHAITANTPGMVFQCQWRAREPLPLFTYVSEGALPLLGLSPGDIMSHRHAVPDSLVGEDRAAFLASLQASAATMSVWHWEGRLAAAGEDGWLECRATPRAAGAGIVIWEGVMFDISASKRAAEEIRTSRQLLRDLSAHMETVREEESKRIAREIHDELGQAMTALRMDVSLLRLHFGGSSPQLLERIHGMTDVVDRTIHMVRNITSSLRPVALDLGLLAALEWQVEAFERHAGIACTLSSGAVDELALDESVATALFRIVQESLTNVAKHAGASKVEVSIVLEDDALLCLKIRDNGCGFALAGARKATSFGLLGLRERSMMLGGTLDIISAPGQGTLIEVCVPYGGPANEV